MWFQLSASLVNVPHFHGHWFIHKKMKILESVKAKATFWNLLLLFLVVICISSLYEMRWNDHPHEYEPAVNLT